MIKKCKLKLNGERTIQIFKWTKETYISPTKICGWQIITNKDDSCLGLLVICEMKDKRMIGIHYIFIKMTINKLLETI